MIKNTQNLFKNSEQIITDKIEETKKKEWKEASKKELEDWYKNRQEQLNKTHSSNK